MTATRIDLTRRLPPSLPPRGLSREEAAAYIGVSPGLLDRMVAAGTMPRPRRAGEAGLMEDWAIVAVREGHAVACTGRCQRKDHDWCKS